MCKNLVEEMKQIATDVSDVFNKFERVLIAIMLSLASFSIVSLLFAIVLEAMHSPLSIPALHNSLLSVGLGLAFAVIFLLEITGKTIFYAIYDKHLAKVDDNQENISCEAVQQRRSVNDNSLMTVEEVLNYGKNE